MANIIPVLIALQASHMSRKSSCLDRCRRCQYYKGQFEKCKGDKTPEYDWKYCPENDW